MKYLFPVLLILLIVACGPANEPKEKIVSPTSPSLPESNASTIDKRTALLDHIAEYIPNWQVMPPQFWLPTQYIIDYNTNLPEADQISFEENTIIFGDFNGDQKEDAVGLLMNKKSEVWLMALFGKDGGYDMEPIFPKDEGVFQKCCLGIGLKTLPAGAYTDTNSGNEAQLKFDGIEYTVYDKVSFLVFLDNGRFRTIKLGE